MGDGERAPRRPASLLVVVGAVVLAAFTIFFLSGAGDHDLRRWVTDFTYLPLAIGSTFLCLRASRLDGLDPRTRRAWRILALAGAAKIFGDTVWWWQEAVRSGTPPFPSVADIGFLAFIPLVLTGLLTFPSRPRSRRDRTRAVLDAATLMTGGAMALWYLVLGPTIAAGGVDPLSIAVSIAYPVGDLVLLFGVLSLLVRDVHTVSRSSLRILVVAIAAHIVADVQYGYVGLHQAFFGGSWPDLLWLTATFLLGVSASQQVGRRHVAAAAPKGSSSTVSRLPYAAVALGYVILVIEVRHVPFHPLGGLVLGAVVLTTLVAIRQHAALTENARLLALVDESMAELRRQATHDGLTGLANRSTLRDHLVASELDGATAPHSVLFLDVDDFKDVNDTYGHDAGDALLVQIAERLRQSVRPGDLVARVGGDEFVIVVPTAGAADVASRVLDDLASPFVLDDHQIVVTVSIGLADADASLDAMETLRQADRAMYSAKRGGKGRYQSFGEPLIPRAG